MECVYDRLSAASGPRDTAGSDDITNMSTMDAIQCQKSVKKKFKYSLFVELCNNEKRQFLSILPVRSEHSIGNLHLNYDTVVTCNIYVSFCLFRICIYMTCFISNSLLLQNNDAKYKLTTV